MPIFVAIFILASVMLLITVALLRMFRLAAENIRRCTRVMFAGCLFLAGIGASPAFAQPWNNLDWYCPSQAGWSASGQEMLEFISKANKEYDPSINVLGACNDLSDNIVYVAWSPRIQTLGSVIGNIGNTSSKFVQEMRAGFNQGLRANTANSLNAVKRTFYELYGVIPMIEVKYSNDPEFFFGDNYIAIMSRTRINIIIPGVYATEQSIAVGRILIKRAGYTFLAEINYTNDLSGEITIYDLVNSFIVNNTLP